MLAEIYRKLQAEKRGERIEGWNALRQGLTSGRIRRRALDWDKVYDILFTEHDEGVRQIALLCLLTAHKSGNGGARSAPAPAPAPRHGRKVGRHHRTLLSEFWSPFRGQRSVVLGLTERGVGRRDDDALVQLGRRLNHDDFPLTEFNPFQIERNDRIDWQRLLFERQYKAVCLVGRITLFGEAAENLLVSGDCRFSFPKGLQHAPVSTRKLDEVFHCIHERIGNGTQFHCASIREGIRSDFGILQRYPVRIGDSWIIVVHIAGTTSLGTWAAARFAALDLGAPQGVGDGVPIPVPAGVNWQTPIEALVETAAPNSDYLWRPNGIRLLKLYVGAWQWKSDTLRFERVNPRQIELVDIDGAIEQIRLDGKPLKVRMKCQSGRLAVALLTRAMADANRNVPVAALAADESIWRDGSKEEAEVRNRLHLLNRRHLDGTLTISADQVHVGAKIIRAAQEG